MNLVAPGFVLCVAGTVLGAIVLGPSEPCPTTGLSCERTSVVDPDTWYPLCVGTRWTYRNTNAMATTNQGVAETRWDSTEEVTSRTSCGGGLVVRIDVTPSNIERRFPAGLAADSRTWFEKNVAVPSTKGYLVRGSAMYLFTPTSWAEPCRSLTQERLREIDASGPEFYFPLDDRAMWSDRKREEEDYAAICAAYGVKVIYRIPCSTTGVSRAGKTSMCRGIQHSQPGTSRTSPLVGRRTRGLCGTSASSRSASPTMDPCGRRPPHS